jgi:hypothetical protein
MHTTQFRQLLSAVFVAFIPLLAHAQLSDRARRDCERFQNITLTYPTPSELIEGGMKMQIEISCKIMPSRPFSLSNNGVHASYVIEIRNVGETGIGVTMAENFSSMNSGLAMKRQQILEKDQSTFLFTTIDTHGKLELTGVTNLYIKDIHRGVGSWIGIPAFKRVPDPSDRNDL